MFPTPVTARYIRIYSFYYEGHEEHIRCHKFELIGCLNDGIFISRPQCEKNLSLGVCEQQRLRPACATAQSDQHLCNMLI